MSSLPLIGITMGDPAGIGPEIILRALSEESLFRHCRPVVLGDPEILRSSAERISLHPRIREIPAPSDVASMPGTIDLIPVSRLLPSENLPAKPTLQGGEAMVQYVLRAVELVLQGWLQAVVTAPISKALMKRAGYPYEGHTPLIAQLTGSDDYVMMLTGDRMRVALATIHCALGDVPRILDQTRVYRTIRVTAEALKKDFALRRPRIAVAGLNPHGGESGLFGREEEKIIQPSIKRAQQEGHDVTGPLAPDTVFYKMARGDFDAVVAMYHDQGLIPLKLLHFADAVNITLGLPIVRTSVDHGTAYDIAGTGRADPSSLKAAIRMAAQIVGNRCRSQGPIR